MHARMRTWLHEFLLHSQLRVGDLRAATFAGVLGVARTLSSDLSIRPMCDSPKSAHVYMYVCVHMCILTNVYSKAGKALE